MRKQDRAAYHRKYAEDNRIQRRQTRREWEAKVRDEVLAHYGKRCRCCSERLAEFLVVEHIGGSGARRRVIGRVPLNYWLWKNNFPTGFRVLCRNCAESYEVFGYCPHRDAAI